ncbi:hypothetical protein DFJ74DRAFT_667679 [Hyaloraphidium curvatum]|nr:hypothetical protein DFJ74DRAFT_667679 [Hyaloraphidium curvatum]
MRRACTLATLACGVALGVLAAGAAGSLARTGGDPRPAEPAVFVAGTLDSCSAGTLLQLAATAGPAHPVLALVGVANVSRTLLARLRARGVQFINPAALPVAVGNWTHFRSYSGDSKRDFLRWLRASDHDHAWLVEHDALFTGKWEDFFGGHRGSPADATGNWDSHSTPESWWWAPSCVLPGEVPCLDPAGGRNLTQFYWAVSRVSRRLATNILAAVEAGARGHHEALAGAVCDRDPDCSFAPFDPNMIGTYKNGHWGPLLEPKSLERLAELGNGTVGPGKLYHPVKCEAERGLAVLAASYAVP